MPRNFHVLTSEHPISPNVSFHCCKCSKPATFWWPATSDQPEPYCSPCLDAAKHRLAVALGISSL